MKRGNRILREYVIGDKVIIRDNYLCSDPDCNHQDRFREHVGKVGTIVGPRADGDYWVEGSLPIWAVQMANGDILACNGFELMSA